MKPHSTQKAMPPIQGHGLERLKRNLFRVAIDRLFAFVVFIYEKAVDKRYCVYHKDPNKHCKWAVI
jgi:hypothetical protein